MASCWVVVISGTVEMERPISRLRILTNPARITSQFTGCMTNNREHDRKVMRLSSGRQPCHAASKRGLLIRQRSCGMLSAPRPPKNMPDCLSLRPMTVLQEVHGNLPWCRHSWRYRSRAGAEGVARPLVTQLPVPCCFGRLHANLPAVGRFPTRLPAPCPRMPNSSARCPRRPVPIGWARWTRACC